MMEVRLPEDILKDIEGNPSFLLPSNRIDLVKLKRLYNQSANKPFDGETDELSIIASALSMGLLSNRQAKRARAAYKHRFRLNQFKLRKKRFVEGSNKATKPYGVKAGLGNWTALHHKGTKGGAKKIQNALQAELNCDKKVEELLKDASKTFVVEKLWEGSTKVGIVHETTLLLKTI